MCDEHQHGGCHNHSGCHHGEGTHHCNHGEGHHCHGAEGEHHCNHGQGGCHGQGKGGWGGKRENAGRKCENPKIPFNRRLSEDAINKLKEYAAANGITETEALEKAIENL